jgi:Ca2+-binding EF-hand superfamily protein
MTRKRTPKKSESLEVRLPHGVKRAFMARARSRGRTASSLVREFIDSYLAGADPGTENRRMLKRLAKPAIASTVLGSVIALHLVAPTAASAEPDFKTVFDQLDADKDGKLSPEELSGNVPLAGAAYLQHKEQLGHGAVPMMVAVHSGMMQMHGGADSPEMHANMAKTFSSLDGDGDGAVTFGEFEARHLAMIRQAFDSIDADQDGKVTEQELGSAMEHMPQGMAAHAPMPSFAKLDANHDGAISWTEFLG